MTIKQIEKKMIQEMKKFEAAKKIRELLDEVLKEIPADDREMVQEEILNLVCEEE